MTALDGEIPNATKHRFSKNEEFYDKLLEKTLSLLAQKVVQLYEGKFQTNRQLPLPPCEEMIEAEATMSPATRTRKLNLEGLAVNADEKDEDAEVDECHRQNTSITRQIDSVDTRFFKHMRKLHKYLRMLEMKNANG